MQVQRVVVLAATLAAPAYAGALHAHDSDVASLVGTERGWG